MTHTSCDCCRKDLLCDGDIHYSVRMETRKVEAPLEFIDDDFGELSESDSVHEMTLLLAEEMEAEMPRPAKLLRKEFHFCDDCYRRFSADPLGLERIGQRRFSAN